MPLTSNYKEAQLAARALEGKIRAESARSIQISIQRYIATIETQIKRLPPGANQAARTRFLRASQSVFDNAANRLESQVVQATTEGRAVMFEESQAVMAEAADRAADIVGIDKAALGAVKVPPVSMLGAYENLGATVSWKTLVNSHIASVKDEVNFIVREAILDGADPRALARGLRQYVVGDESLRAAMSKKGFDWRKARAAPGTRGAARRIDFNARRISFSEIHNARREAEAQHFAADPFIRAVRWTLAPDRGSANIPDECDVLAVIDAYGMGPGIYPVNKVPGSPHPFDRCEIEPVTTDDPVTAAQPIESPPFRRGAVANLPIPNVPKGGRLSRARARRIREHASDSIAVGNRAELQSILDDLAKAAEDAMAQTAPTAATLAKAQRALELREQGFTFTEIGQALGTNDSNAFRLVKIAKKEGLVVGKPVIPPVQPIPTPPVPPTAPPPLPPQPSSLTANQVFEIKKNLASGIAPETMGLSDATANLVVKAADDLLAAGEFEFTGLTVQKTANDARFVYVNRLKGQSLESMASQLHLGVPRVRELSKLADELIQQGQFQGSTIPGSGIGAGQGGSVPTATVAQTVPDTAIEFIRPTKAEANALGLKSAPGQKTIENAQTVFRRVAAGASDTTIANELGLGVARIRELKALGRKLKKGGFTKGKTSGVPPGGTPKGVASKFTDDELRFLTPEELVLDKNERELILSFRKSSLEKPGAEVRASLRTKGEDIDFSSGASGIVQTLRGKEIAQAYGKKSFGVSSYEGYPDLMRAVDKMAKPKRYWTGSGNSSYSRLGSEIKMSTDYSLTGLSPETRGAWIFRHEYGHHLDNMLGSFNKYRGYHSFDKRAALKKAYDVSLKNAKANSTTFKQIEDTLRHFNSHMPVGGRDIVNDLIHSLTWDFGDVANAVGARRLGYGHPRSYLLRKGNAETEFFANWFSVMSAPDNAVRYTFNGITYDLRTELRKIFPQYAKAFDDAIANVVNSGTTPPLPIGGPNIPPGLTGLEAVAHLKAKGFKTTGSWYFQHDTARKAQRSVRTAFTDGEKRAVNSYINNGYVQINKRLRDKERITPTITNIDRVIARSEIPENMTIWRGGRAPVEGRLRVGATYTDPGFLSCSSKQSIARKFVASGGRKRVMIEIRLRKGQRGYAVNPSNYSEYEVLLPRDAEFIIVDVVNTQHIIVEMI
jgi:hypothetical protein